MQPSVPTLISLKDAWVTVRFTVQLLRERLREDRLGLTAGSLTFTTALSLVPLLAVALAVFSAFPAFGKLQLVLQDYLLENLMPPNMAEQVLRYLTTFAIKARSLTWAGLSVVVVTAIALMLTIDKTFQSIWRVAAQRPVAQRVLVYWGAITLGPLVLAAVFSVSSYVGMAAKGWSAALPLWAGGFAQLASVALIALALAGLYKVIPNSPVSWEDAITGGIFAAIAFELAKRVFTGYVTAQPTYTSVYGTFALFPLLLLWIFTSWLIVLCGAVIVAYLPSIHARARATPRGAGGAFVDALALVRTLHAGQQTGQTAQSAADLARALRRDIAQIRALCAELAALGWLAEVTQGEQARWALIADLDATPVRPLAERLVFSAPKHSAAPAHTVLSNEVDQPLREWIKAVKPTSGA